MQSAPHHLELGLYGGHLAKEVLQVYRRRFAHGFGDHHPVRDPDHIAAERRRNPYAGLAGCAITCFQQLDELA